MSTWVLLRGLMREHRHWDAFPALLAQAMPEARIVAPDAPGNGIHCRMRSLTRVADMVDFLRADLAARQLKPPYHLLALSLGGMAAVDWCARFPGEVAGAVLVNTSMRPFSAFHRRLRWQNYPAIAAHLLLGGLESQERLILRLTSRARDADPDRVARWVGFQREAPVQRANALRQLLAAARFRAPDARPQTPLLVLASHADRLVDVSCSQRLAMDWQAELRLHPNAGHDLPLDDGVWVAKTAAQWAATLADGAPG